jgi:hypothetical protein
VLAAGSAGPRRMHVIMHVRLQLPQGQIRPIKGVHIGQSSLCIFVSLAQKAEDSCRAEDKGLRGRTGICIRIRVPGRAIAVPEDYPQGRAPSAHRPGRRHPRRFSARPPSMPMAPTAPLDSSLGAAKHADGANGVLGQLARGRQARQWRANGPAQLRGTADSAVPMVPTARTATQTARTRDYRDG